MLKQLLAVLAATALVLQLVNDLTNSRTAVARAQATAARLERQRDSLVNLVRRRDRARTALTIQRETHEAEVTRLRDSVIALERRLEVARLTGCGAGSGIHE